jgi:translation initiation factor IF-3
LAKGRVQPQAKVQDDKYNYRLNREINAPRIRLVGENFDEVSEVAKKPIETGIYNTYHVLQWAEELEMDLVEISPNADPPVCKIIDYKKFIYDRKKKEKELKPKLPKQSLRKSALDPILMTMTSDLKSSMPYQVSRRW